ncbi:methyltransferase domain-containing protein [candidate division GN15 bacterium]|nr:methyltransferase domain-containing protein [candidate division GN15 bacterium]
MRKAAINLVERGMVPEPIVRVGVRRLLRERLAEETSGSPQAQTARIQTLVDEMSSSPVALVPEKPNEQHYEVPPAFFEYTLGPHLKYSCCYWPKGTGSLESAEAAMLALTCQRAELRDGMEILELGCGWGSLTLWMARAYPDAKITAVSNSAPQKAFIDYRARVAGLENIEVITADMNDFAIERQFDRVVSVEMFEHMRNYRELMRRIAGWLKPQGKLFVHIFCHSRFAYPFVSDGPGDWMAEHFFTGGLMPSDNLLLHFQEDLRLQTRWRVNGEHYARSARAWLDNMARNRRKIIELFSDVYGPGEGKRWYVRWRLFFIACEELWGYNEGEEWLVSHYLFKKR